MNGIEGEALGKFIQNEYDLIWGYKYTIYFTRNIFLFFSVNSFISFTQRHEVYARSSPTPDSERNRHNIY